MLPEGSPSPERGACSSSGRSAVECLERSSAIRGPTDVRDMCQSAHEWVCEQFRKNSEAGITHGRGTYVFQVLATGDIRRGTFRSADTQGRT